MNLKSTLQKFDITIPEIKKKISLEQVWNKLIFDLIMISY
jgi:hypothetical protein